MTDTRITSVSVYRSGCIITRTAELDLEQGPQTVKLAGPGPGADPQSLRLSVPEGVQGANVQMDYLTEEQKEESLKELAKKQEKVERGISDLEAQIALWKRNSDFSAKENISLADMTVFLEQLPLHADEFVDGFDHVYRDTNGPGLIRDRSGDGLSDPPGGVRAELVALGVIELVNGLDKT